MKTAAGSDLSLGSGDYHEDGELAVMAMASFYVKIRHVFCFTFLVVIIDIGGIDRRLGPISIAN